MIIAQAIPDISSVPAEFMKSWWIMLGFLVAIALLGYNTYIARQTKPREISGSIETRPGKEHASQDGLNKLERSVSDLSAQMAAQFAMSKTQGEYRVVAITQDINEQMSAISIKVGTLAEALHDKINHTRELAVTAQTEIANLKAADFRHDAQVAAIQRHIEELLKGSSKPHRT